MEANKPVENEFEQPFSNFLADLHHKNIELWLEGDTLRYKAPKGGMTPQIMEYLKKRKAELIQYLRDCEETRNQADSIFYEPISSIPVQEYYPLSSAQKRMFVLNQLEPKSTAYNLIQVLKLVGPVDRERIHAVIQQLMNRHEILRTSFELVDGNMVQKVHPTLDFLLEYTEVDITEETEIEQLINRFIQPFDLMKPPLFRFKLVKLNRARIADTYLLLYDTHHIISDGFSMGVLVQEINALYAGQALPEIKVQYKDFVTWHQKLLASDILKNQKAYWHKKFEGEIPVLDLKPDYPRPAVYRFEGFSLKQQVSKELVSKIYQLARKNHATLYHVLLSAYYILLARYSGQSDIVVGTPTAGRRHADLNNGIGIFLNTLALRNFLDTGKPFEEFLREVSRDVLTAFDHQEYPFEDLVEGLNIKRDLSRNPLFDAMFILQNMNIYQVEVAGLEVSSYEFKRNISQLDLVLVATENQNGLELEFTYCTQIYSRQTAERFFQSYLKIISGIASHPERSIAAIDIISDAEKSRLVHGFNDTGTPYPAEKTIQQLFEEQVERSPEHIAVIFNDNPLTYREFNTRANQLAVILRNQKVGPGCLVGILMERSAEMLIGIMGILKAGGAYVPLDPDYPAERIEYMVNDSHAMLVLTRGETAGRFNLQVDQLDFDELMRMQADGSNPDRINTARDLAYVIYTSGSTGKPKGVMIEHQSVHNFIHGMTQRIDFTPGKKILGITTISFDIFGLETLASLAKGLTVVLAGEREQLDPFLLGELIKKHGIDLIQATPSRMQILLNTAQDLSWLKNLSVIMIGGEAFPENLLQQLIAITAAKIYNMYGPTETTIWSTVKDLTAGTGINIGAPIANTQVYIVDPNLKLQPMGVAGELCIAGDGLARGYWERPELTAEKFVPIPDDLSLQIKDYRFNKPDSENSNLLKSGSRMYRTGDLARWLPDGNIEFLGRIDHQVKIRGYRIELGEIEARLRIHEAVKEVVVIAKEDGSGNKYLCAYFSGERQLPVQDLRDYIAEILPEYMIPSYFVQLEHLPLTPNGKVDRKALPEPAVVLQTGMAYTAPETNLEMTISEAWKEILNLDKVGVHDQFFDLGGNSLNIIKLNVLLNQKLGRQIPTVILFQYPTIHSLAQYLTQQDDAGGSISKVSKRSNSILSMARDGVDIAVVGMAGRFPGAKNIREFWDNLKNGRESITFFADAELQAAGVEQELLANPNYVKAKGILDQIEFFDANFFGYSPNDAQILDPQIRIFHECIWEALEDAGYNPFTYQGSIGLYAGANANYYWDFLALALGSREVSEQFAQTQMFDRFLSSRISYKLNLKGPSIFTATACSTGLVAVHLACRALLTGECDMALAGGAALALPQKSGYLYQEGMILSPDGHCRAFDAGAKGTVWGEGAGVVALKRMSQAIADGDNIYAVIKGTAVNNDGFRKVGYTAPSIEGQVEVIQAAHQTGRVEPESISYIEAHGTGTVLGDPIEIEALKNAFHTDKKQFCRIGSVKTNIGHLDTAAGIAGLIKTVLALQHKQIPPSLHYQTPNPKIDFTNSPFIVNSRLTDWQNDLYPLRAGVSSFGIGGTNAHAVLEEAPKLTMPQKSRPWQLVLISAKTETALERIGENLVNHLQCNSDVIFADLAYTLAVGRAHFPHRRMAVCADSGGAAALLTKQAGSSLAVEEKPNLIFMFPGQGSQYLNMGRDLYETEALFREEIDRCNEILRPIINLDLKMVLYDADPDNKENLEHRSIYNTALTQPVIFCVEYAMAKLLMKWGLKPQYMIGHSIGEYVAACLAGVFSLEDALSLVACRGQMMQEMAGGAMLSVPLSEAEITPLLGGSLSLAAVNSPSMCVVSGPVQAIEALEEQLKRQDTNSIRLQVSHAFHSMMMEPMLPGFLEKISHIKLSAPQLRYLSNVTGNWITAEEATSPEYWVRHLRNTVRFSDGINRLLETGRATLIEVGGGRTLTGLVRVHPAYRMDEHGVFNSMRHPKEDVSDVHHLLAMVGKLWCKGMEIDWEGFYAEERRRRISLPAYPFDRKRYWIDGNIDAMLKGIMSQKAPLGQKRDLDEWFYAPSWKQAELLTAGKDRANYLISLVFTNDTRFSVQLTERLRQTESGLILIKIGAEFQKENDNCYYLNPKRPEDYQNLFQDLYQSRKIPQKITHLWTFTEENPGRLDFNRVEQAMDLGLYSLIYIVQAIGGLNVTDQVLMKVVTNNMQCVTGEEILCPEKAMALGPIKIIPQEYPNLKCENIDIEIPPSGIMENQLLNRLLSDLAVHSGDSLVAYRAGSRWVQSFEPIQLNQSRPIPFRLRKNGVYLLTGGLGGVGLVLAESLVKSVQAKLILIGRSGLPARSDWEQWLNTHPKEDKVSYKIRKVRELEGLGGKVTVVNADISDMDRMKNSLTKIKEKFGAINGIIHCAGLADGGMIQLRNRKDIDSILAPKVKGTMILNELFQGIPLDFMILCSSINSIIPVLGQVGYCAANSFLDAYAHYKNKCDNIFTVSINWDTWQEVGMAVEAARSNDFKNSADILENGILSGEGTEVLQRILDNNLSELPAFHQIIVSTRSLMERYQESAGFNINNIHTGLSAGKKQPHYTRPDLIHSYIAPRNAMEDKLATIWQEVLGFEKVGIDDEFFELGGDSLKALKLIKVAEQQNIKITVADIFKYKTIAKISEDSEYGKAERAVSRLKLESAASNAADILKVENRWSSLKDFLIDAPEAKELKIEIQRDITVNRHRALPLCIVLADPKLHPWYYEHFINIFSSVDPEDNLTLDFLEIWALYRDVIGEISLGAEFMNKETDIIRFIIEKINHGYYINIAVDEYYLPGKERYQKTHFIHHELVYGYDNAARTIKAIGYDAGGIFDQSRIPYDVFLESYEKGKMFYQESAPWTLRTAVQLFYSNGFDTVHPFDINKFLKEIHNYLSSTGDASIIYYWMQKNRQISFGFEVYDVVLNHLENLLQGKLTMDYQAIHLLYEQKKAIARRLDYVINWFHLRGKFLELYQGYLKIADRFNDLRLKFFDLQYNFKVGGSDAGIGAYETIVRQIMQMLNSMKEEERILLMEMYEILIGLVLQKNQCSPN
jgi:amino acid adenylation domain-containing protein